MILIENLTKTYGKIIALHNTSFFFPNNQVIAIMGENGAGKSTLLKICAGILPYDTGTIHIDRYSIESHALEARKQLGYLPEMPEIYDRLTGREFLHYIAALRHITKPQETISDFADMIGISEFLDYEVGGYSKGMKQKISMISALMHTPNNLLLDEPVYGLDPLTTRTIKTFIQKRKGTTIIATHSTGLVEDIADRVYFLMKGRVIADNTLKEITTVFDTVENAYFHYKEQPHV